MKKIIATLLTATLVVANCIPAFADAVQDVTGTGAVEVDNSEAVSYYKVTLPSLVSSNYDMTLDPTKQLIKYDAATYAADKTVYFTKTETPVQLDYAKTKGTGTGAKVQYKEDNEATSDEVKAFVTGATLDSDGNVTAVEVDEDAELWLWVPDTTTGNEGMGKPLALDDSNILTYFDVVASNATTITSVTMKANHLANGVICAPKVYKSTLTELDDDCDLDAHDEYFDKDGQKITGEALKTIDAVTEKTDTTDDFTVINKSTKDLVLTATVTLNNAKDLTMRSSSTFASDDDKASLYIAVTDGTTPVALTKASEDATTASAVLPINLAKATVTEITYQGGENAKTGGHDYKKFEDYGTVYNPGSFSITAAANGNSSAVDNWAEYAETITDSTKRPTLNVVYSVAEKVNSYTVTYNANDEEAAPASVTESVAANGHPTKATADGTGIAKEGWSIVGWYTDAECTEGNEFNASSTVTANIPVYAKWEQDTVVPSVPTTKTITAGENATIAVNLGIGENVAATGISELKWGRSADSTTTTLVEGTHYNYSNGTITLLPSVSAGASGTRYLKVVFTGGGTPSNDIVEITIE